MQDRVIDNKTISGIVGSINEPTTTNTNRNLSHPEIIDMYAKFEAEGHYDVDDISTMICEVLVTELNESLDGSVSDHNEDIMGCRMIYDIFDICKKHVAKVNAMHDAIALADKNAQASADYLRGLIAPR